MPLRVSKLALSKLAKKPAIYQLGPFEVGQVKAHLSHGLSAAEISRRIFKPDGRTHYGETAISNCIDKLRQQPKWRGERQKGSGRPRKTTTQQDTQIIRYLLKQRGKENMTVNKLKKAFLFLRKLSNTLVEDRCFEAHLKYMRRPNKSIVTKAYLADRVTYSHGVKRKRQETLEKWAYVDGTTFYLDRTEDELEHTQRRALGTMVWRRSDNKDAKYQDVLGPSSYNKGQGKPVRVWGMLACGGLHIHVVEEGEVMNQMLYVELIEDHFTDWCGDCEYLVCDYERFLRSDESLHALSKTPLKLVDPYPKVSQDFNAIENAWAILKARLLETAPTHLESREEFIKRLHAAVKWMNKYRAKRLWELSTNQKERAEECLAQKPPGGRTSY